MTEEKTNREKILERALRLVVEQELLSDGATPKGVQKWMGQQVQMYIDMASGKRNCFYGSTQ